MKRDRRTPRHRLEEKWKPPGPEESYSVQVGGKTGLQMISVLAKSEREAVQKLADIAGENRVHTQTFSKNGTKLPDRRWQNRM